MLKKAVLLLLVCFLIVIPAALLLPWRTQGTLKPGESRSYTRSGDFVIQAAGDRTRFYDLTALAPQIEQGARFSATGGLAVLDQSTAVTPKEIKWTEGSRSNQTDYTAPGAELTLKATVRAPADTTEPRLEKIEWTSQLFQDDAAARTGFLFKHGGLVWKGDHVVMGECILGTGAGYWMLCLRKAFFATVPLALLLFGCGAYFVFRERRPPPAPEAPASTRLFPPRYADMRGIFCLLLIILAGIGSLLAVAVLCSTAGENLEDHTLLALWSAIAFLVLLFAACVQRLLTVKRVSAGDSGLEIDYGDGWGKKRQVRWEEIEEARPIAYRRHGAVVARALKLRLQSGQKLRLSSGGIHDYADLEALILEMVQRHHPEARQA